MELSIIVEYIAQPKKNVEEREMEEDDNSLSIARLA